MNKCHKKWFIVFWAWGIDKQWHCNKSHLHIKRFHDKVRVNIHG